MTSSEKIESVKYEDCSHISAGKIKNELLNVSCSDNLPGEDIINQGESLEIKKEEQEVYFASSPACGPTSNNLHTDSKLPLHGLIPDDLNTSLDVQMEVEVSTSEFEGNEMVPSEKFFDQSHSDSHLTCTDALFSELADGSQSVGMEVEVCTSEPISVAEDDSYLAPLIPEMFQPVKIPPLIEHDDTNIDSNCASDEGKSVRSRKHVPDIVNGRCITICSDDKLPPHDSSNTCYRPNGEKRYCYRPVSSKTIEKYRQSNCIISSEVSRKRSETLRSALTGCKSSADKTDKILFCRSRTETFSSRPAPVRACGWLHQKQLLPFNFPCSLCKLQFTTLNGLNMHKLSNHFSSKRLTKYHQHSKRQVRPKKKTSSFKCIECKARYPSIALLDEHMERAHPLKFSSDS